VFYLPCDGDNVSTDMSRQPLSRSDVPAVRAAQMKTAAARRRASGGEFRKLKRTNALKIIPIILALIVPCVALAAESIAIEANG
jgi:hypothetical protein